MVCSTCKGDNINLHKTTRECEQEIHCIPSGHKADQIRLPGVITQHKKRYIRRFRHRDGYSSDMQ